MNQNYSSGMQQKTAETIKGSSNVRGDDPFCAVGVMPQRDTSPVEVSMARLFECIGQLKGEVDQLTDRLVPVSRMESTSGNACSERSLSECEMVERLDQASEHIEATMARLSNARARLCI